MNLLEMEGEALSPKQAGFCEMGGIFGILISLTCLIQHIIFMIPHWITFSIMAVYILSIIAFLLLALKSEKAYSALIISTILIFLLNAAMILLLTFSLALIILLIYAITVLILFVTGETQKQLKQQAVFKRSEKEKWNNINY